MPIVRDYIRKRLQNYFAPTKQDVKVGRKEEILVAGDAMFPEQKNDPFTKKLSVEKCVNVAEQCPLFMKAARKKSKDSIRAWHRIEHVDKTKKPVKIDLQHIENFSRRNQLKSLWKRLRVAAFTAGDGYLLITFENDRTRKLANPPSKNSIPYKVNLLKSQNITEIGFNPDRPEDAKNLIKSFHYVEQSSGKDLWIYPDRIIHMANDQLFGEFGNSKANLLRNIIKSSVNVDIATGEILAWFAHGLLDIMLDDANENQIKKWETITGLHPGAYIHGKEEAEIKAIAPQAIDPKPFYDYLILNIAAAYFMPTHILTGIQIGKVTGAEIGTGDYVKDLKDDQELDYNPLLERLYSMILKAHGRSWSNYEIIWNPIYIDELSEADILEKKVRAAEMALNGIRGAGGLIDLEEARRIFNDGQIKLDPKKKIKVRERMETADTPQGGKNDKDDKDDDGKENTTDIQYTLSPETKAMIEKRKKQLAKEEKRLGEEILKEQDKDATSDKD